MQLYTKAIIALLGVLLPFLQQIGVALPDFLTVEWVSTILLALTPVLVFWFPNINKQGVNISTDRMTRSPATIGILAALLSLLVLSGCQTIGAPAPESFNDRAGYAYGTHTAVLETVTGALNHREISSSEAMAAAEIADRARELIDSARRVYTAGDTPGATSQLNLALAILSELQAHLRGDPL